MTTPAAASTDASGSRVYRVPGTDTFFPSASSTIKVLDAPALDAWKIRTCAEAAVTADMIALARANPSLAISKIKSAPYDQNAKSDLGTRVHAATEVYDTNLMGIGVDPGTGEVEADVALYLAQHARMMADHQIRPVIIEATVFNHTHAYAGTLDRIVWHPKYGYVVADVKTGRGVWPEASLQLAGYANADDILMDGELIPLRVDNPNPLAPSSGRNPLCPELRTDVALIFHLADDGYEVIPLDLTDAWPAFQAVNAAWRWVHHQGRASIGSPLEVPAVVVGAGEPLRITTTATGALLDGQRLEVWARVRLLRPEQQDILKNTWASDLPSLKAIDGWTTELLGRVAGMITILEQTVAAEPLPKEWPAVKQEQRPAVTAAPEIDPLARTIRDEARTLPTDLRQWVVDEAAKIKLPSVHRLELYIVEQLERLAKIVDAAKEHHRTRVTAICTQCPNDELRHEFADRVSNHRTASSRELTAEEAELFHCYAEGDSRVDAALPLEFDWKEKARAAGTTASGLMRRARTLSVQHNLPGPGKLEDIPPTSELGVLLEEWLAQKATAAA